MKPSSALALVTAMIAVNRVSDKPDFDKLIEQNRRALADLDAALENLRTKPLEES